MIACIRLSDFHLTHLEALKIHRGISEQLCHNVFHLFPWGAVKYIQENQIILEMHCIFDYYIYSKHVEFFVLLYKFSLNFLFWKRVNLQKS